MKEEIIQFGFPKTQEERAKAAIEHGRALSEIIKRIGEGSKKKTLVVYSYEHDENEEEKDNEKSFPQSHEEKQQSVEGFYVSNFPFAEAVRTVVKSYENKRNPLRSGARIWKEAFAAILAGYVSERFFEEAKKSKSTVDPKEFVEKLQDDEKIRAVVDAIKSLENF